MDFIKVNIFQKTLLWNKTSPEQQFICGIIKASNLEDADLK